MNDNADHLWIITWRQRTKDGWRRCYRVRGYGPRSTALWLWLSQRDLTHEWDDFPWAGFSLVRDEDEATLREQWSDAVTEEADRIELEPEPEPIDPVTEAIETELHALLLKEVLDEINQQIISEISGVR